MISKEKLVELRQRMHNHQVVAEHAVVVLTAKELQVLLDEIEDQQGHEEWENEGGK